MPKPKRSATDKETWQRCERCNELLKPGTEVFLELAIHGGRYSDPDVVSVWPLEDSQGGFPFGKACAKRVLRNDGVLSVDDLLRREGSRARKGYR